MNTYNSGYIPRVAAISDKEKIAVLYKEVSSHGGGIARTKAEITNEYIEQFITASFINGIQLVVDNPDNSDEIIAEVHCYKLKPQVFDHVLSELTVVVHPSYQRRGIARCLFEKLFDIIENERTDICRVELITKESNKGAIELYRQLGFRAEGRLSMRIKTNSGYEDDIPFVWFNKKYPSI